MIMRLVCLWSIFESSEKCHLLLNVKCVLNFTLLFISSVRYFIRAQFIAGQPFLTTWMCPVTGMFSQSIDDNSSVINVLTLKTGKGKALKTFLPLSFVPAPRKPMQLLLFLCSLWRKVSVDENALDPCNLLYTGSLDKKAKSIYYVHFYEYYNF